MIIQNYWNLRLKFTSLKILDGVKFDVTLVVKCCFYSTTVYVASNISGWNNFRWSFCRSVSGRKDGEILWNRQTLTLEIIISLSKLILLKFDSSAPFPFPGNILFSVVGCFKTNSPETYFHEFQSFVLIFGKMTWLTIPTYELI